MSHFTIFFLYLGIIGITTIYSIAKKEPTKVPKSFIGLYNIVNSIINLYLVCGLYNYVFNKNFGIYNKSDDLLRYYIYIHYLCKYLDFIDTIIMILSHKWQQVHFLQLFHHSTIGVIWHWILTIAPNDTATWAFGAFANSLIHFLMYLHYFITSQGINNPFKNLMTSLQISQFIICLFHSFIGMIYIPSLFYASFVQIFYMLSMLILFYIYVFKKSKNISKINESTKLMIIHINGNDYNVTDFIKKHPGGNIIEQYTIDKVYDATDTFNTFHFNSKTAIKILSTLTILNTKPYITNDLQKLIYKWKQDGLYKSRLISFTIWASIIFGITLLGYFCLKYGYPILGGIIVGIGWTHCGFVQHHAGHLSITGKPEYDFVIASFFESVLKGGSNRWWRSRHNKHHAMTNSIEYDGDLRTTPFFAWDDILVKKVPTFLLRIQHLLFIPMLILYVPVFFITTKLFVIRKKYWDELGLICFHFYLSSFFYTNLKDFIIFYCIGYALQGLYLGIMFGLNHFSMVRVYDINTEWIKWQLISTCNWGIDSIFAQYISGYLNLQIEHHIVPQMPAENYKHIINDLRIYAKEHNLPYTEISFIKAFYNMINGLRLTAEKELLLRKSKKK
jgi:fatty acid desaturase